VVSTFHDTTLTINHSVESEVRVNRVVAAAKDVRRDTHAVQLSIGINDTDAARKKGDVAQADVLAVSLGR
jgi:hypothetical protein